MAATMARYSHHGLEATKQALWVEQEIASLHAAIEFEDRNQLMAGFTDNLPEAIRAFDEGRRAGVPRPSPTGPVRWWVTRRIAVMTIRVAVLGATGRMGSEVCRTVEGEDDLELVAAVDPGRAGERLGPIVGTDSELTVEHDVAGIAATGATVAVDFSHREAAVANLAWLADHGVHAVVGTTGFTAEDIEALRSRFRDSSCLVAANFAIGAVLLMRFAELAAPWFETAEIVELHHDAKIDAPSGTAMATAERIAAASVDWAEDPTRHELLEGARGGVGPAGIRVHSVRLRGLVAHQEVLFGTTGQTLTIRHDSIDRTSFMGGVAHAVRHVADRPGVTIGLEPLLGLG